MKYAQVKIQPNGTYSVIHYVLSGEEHFGSLIATPHNIPLDNIGSVCIHPSYGYAYMLFRYTDKNSFKVEVERIRRVMINKQNRIIKSATSKINFYSSLDLSKVK